LDVLKLKGQLNNLLIGIVQIRLNELSGDQVGFLVLVTGNIDYLCLSRFSSDLNGLNVIGAVLLHSVKNTHSCNLFEL
jgi:hypothetical protein